MPTTHAYVFTRQGIRQLDAEAINELAIPGIVLMENAAAALERAVLRLLGDITDGHSTGNAQVQVFCGPGNNGGDGFALARRLHNRGIDVRVLSCVQTRDLKGDALTNAEIVWRMRVPALELDERSPARTLENLLDAADDARWLVLVDALFGTGLTRAPESPFDEVIAFINRSRTTNDGARVLAVDIPSGLDCDTGRPLGRAVVRADRTVTLGGLKVGFTNPEAEAFTGEIEVGDIGVPPELLRRLAVKRE